MLSTSTSQTIAKGDSYQKVDEDDEIDPLKLATIYIERSYDLMWNQEDFDQAIVLLERALKIQTECLGRHHKDVGWTCNFIGTGYWKKRQAKQALRYFFEARHIFSKSCISKVKGIDNRIQCILTQADVTPVDLEKYQTALG